MFYPKENNINFSSRWGSIDMRDDKTVRLLYAFKAVRSFQVRKCWDQFSDEQKLLCFRLVMYMDWFEQLTTQRQEGDLLSYKEKLRMDRLVKMQFSLMEIINNIQGGYN